MKFYNIFKWIYTHEEYYDIKFNKFLIDNKIKKYSCYRSNIDNIIYYSTIINTIINRIIYK